MAKPADSQERRHYRRVNAPITIRPVSILAGVVPQRVNDVSLGGLRAFSDEPHKVGKRLELELIFPGGKSATVLAEVVWVETLPPGSPAAYDVGMRYVDAAPGDLHIIQEAIQRQGP